MRANQSVYLAPGRPSLESTYDLPVLDQHERGELRDLELARERRILLDIDVHNAETPLLRHLDPGYEAFHTAGRAGLPFSKEDKRRELC